MAASGKNGASAEASTCVTKHAARMATPPSIPVGLSRSPRKAAAVAAAKRGSVLLLWGWRGRVVIRSGQVTPCHACVGRFVVVVVVPCLRPMHARKTHPPTHLKMMAVSSAGTKASAMDSRTTAKAEVTSPV